MWQKEGILKNLIYAFGAQMISLLLSLLMSVVMPKFLGIEEYSYWQLFIFYTSYVGFFHFGFSDGMYLKLGGKRLEELEGSLLKTEFALLILAECVIACGAAAGAVLFFGEERRFILIVVAIYIVLYNSTLFLGYLFQSVNQTRIFSVSVIIDRMGVLLSIMILAFVGEESFRVYIVSYLISKAAALIYCMKKSEVILKKPFLEMKKVLRDAWENITIGVKLMIANIAGTLIVGIGRMVIDHVWGITTFGKVSLALSMTNFFLVFISQVSMVLFPALRRINQERLREVYSLLQKFLSILLPGVFLLYVPVRGLLLRWLPEYADSIRYLVLLLPICTFDGKMQMLCNTFFKVLRKERQLLTYNLFSLLISVIMALTGGYVLQNMDFVVVSMVIAVGLRSVVSEYVLSRFMEKNILLDLAGELIITMLFMGTAWYLAPWVSWIIIFAAYMAYLLWYRRTVQQMIGMLKGRKEGKKDVTI